MRRMSVIVEEAQRLEQLAEPEREAGWRMLYLEVLLDIRGLLDAVDSRTISIAGDAAEIRRVQRVKFDTLS